MSRTYCISPSTRDTNWQRCCPTCNFLSSPPRRASHHLFSASLSFPSLLLPATAHITVTGEWGFCTMASAEPGRARSPSAQAESKGPSISKSVPGWASENPSANPVKFTEECQLEPQAINQGLSAAFCITEARTYSSLSVTRARDHFGSKKPRLKSLPLLCIEINFKQNHLNM